MIVEQVKVNGTFLFRSASEVVPLDRGTTRGEVEALGRSPLERRKAEIGHQFSRGKEEGKEKRILERQPREWAGRPIVTGVLQSPHRLDQGGTAKKLFVMIRLGTKEDCI